MCVIQPVAINKADEFKHSLRKSQDPLYETITEKN